MAAVLKHWREAATLILVAKSAKHISRPNITEGQGTNVLDHDFNYRILMLKRSTKSKFMPSYSVFPGGMAHESDFSSNWIGIFNSNDKLKEMSLSLDFLGHITEHEGPAVPMFTRERDERFSVIPSELAFRICAIRETFEESGVLLAKKTEDLKSINKSHSPGAVVSIPEMTLASWRQRVDNDANEFLNMCRELSIVPNVWSLYEWSNWLTPVPSGSKTSGRRFDTAFFICVLDNIPTAVHDAKETIASQWSTPDEVIRNYSQSRIGVAPPQLFEISRLLNFHDVGKLEGYMWERSGDVIERILPVAIHCDDGIIVVYPGDDLYPENPDVYGEKEPLSMKGTLKFVGRKSLKKCRLEIDVGTGNMAFICNTEFNGHVRPITDWSSLELGAKANL
ncbi:hypothetical protein ScPMuIL_000467 [Solemya velum]